MPILLLSGIGALIFGRGMVSRLKRLQEKALAIGRGSWGEPLEVAGSDEISDLTLAINQTQADLTRLREKDRDTAKTIEGLNKELRQQLAKVEQLKEQLAEENRTLRDELHSLVTSEEIIGFNGGLRQVAQQVKELAKLPVTVLITGESGTGKELLARYLHKAGPREKGPLVAVNCAALPGSLVESELFGYEKGSFTGATSQKKGKFEFAHGGTLFLDEVGELPAEVQAKLLRVLQDNEVYRVGGNTPITVDVRVVAATNRELGEEVRKGRFREDLFYRLQVVEIRCPRLRERLEDLPALAQHFVELYSRRLGKPVIGISPTALKKLAFYSWPGNIRELENTVARAVALAATQVLGSEDFAIPEPTRANQKRAEQSQSNSPLDAVVNMPLLSSSEMKQKGLHQLLAACERMCVEAALANAKSQKEAAEVLGVTPTKLHRLIKKHAIIKG